MKNYEEEQMKCIVETKGDLSLLTPTFEDIKHDRPTVVPHSTFIDVKLNEGQLKILARDLPKEASDEDFKQVYKELESDTKQAVAAYCSEFGKDPTGIERDDLEGEAAKKKAEEEADTPNYDEMSYQELKDAATELELEYKGNISKDDLLALLKGDDK